jgi:Tfp pilus assembly protein PilF
MSNRLDQLRQFYEEDPSDPFNIYGLALEYLKSDLAKSKALFDELMSKHPEYLPVYYHAAKLYADLNETDRAISIYQEGIAQAKKLKDQKALRELQSAYDELTLD